MLIGFGAYCLLAFSYALFSLTNNAVTFAIVIIASAGGGIGGGLIWVSQSRHYAAMCKDAAGPAPNNFASSFAFWYIGTEGVVKLATASFLTVVDDLTVACTTLFILLVAAYGAMVLRPESCGRPMMKVTSLHLEKRLTIINRQCRQGPRRGPRSYRLATWLAFAFQVRVHALVRRRPCRPIGRTPWSASPPPRWRSSPVHWRPYSAGCGAV